MVDMDTREGNARLVMWGCRISQAGLDIIALGLTVYLAKFFYKPIFGFYFFAVAITFLAVIYGTVASIGNMSQLKVCGPTYRLIMELTALIVWGIAFGALLGEYLKGNVKCSSSSNSRCGTINRTIKADVWFGIFEVVVFLLTVAVAFKNFFVEARDRRNEMSRQSDPENYNNNVESPFNDATNYDPGVDQGIFTNPRFQNLGDNIEMRNYHDSGDHEADYEEIEPSKRH
ncbi:uncharacterized protein V1518DRAFT_415198 [Limtongia smithiae]|uniref:uncharacterized protein n=1 Tax=Limtongia smithiae TaxID=1125753 RepID=UPI0034CEC219